MEMAGELGVRACSCVEYPAAIRSRVKVSAVTPIHFWTKGGEVGVGGGREGM